MSELKLKPRSSFWLTRLLNKLGGSTSWTTVGDTIYYPDEVETPEIFDEILAHESVHLEQYKKYGTFGFLFLYCLIPLPFVFSYFRWKFEREAYVVSARMYMAQNRGTAEHFAINIAATLWNNYMFSWPPALMRKWLLKELSK